MFDGCVGVLASSGALAAALAAADAASDDEAEFGCGDVDSDEYSPSDSDDDDFVRPKKRLRAKGRGGQRKTAKRNRSRVITDDGDQRGSGAAASGAAGDGVMKDAQLRFDLYSVDAAVFRWRSVDLIRCGPDNSAVDRCGVVYSALMCNVHCAVAFPDV